MGKVVGCPQHRMSEILFPGWLPDQSLPQSLESHLLHQIVAFGQIKCWERRAIRAGYERLLSLLCPESVKQFSFYKHFDKLWTLINVFLICNLVWLWLYFWLCHRNWLGFLFKSQVVISCHIACSCPHWGKVSFFNLKLPERTTKLVLFFSKGTRNQRSGVPW